MAEMDRLGTVIRFAPEATGSPAAALGALPEPARQGVCLSRGIAGNKGSVKLWINLILAFFLFIVVPLGYVFGGIIAGGLVKAGYPRAAIQMYRLALKIYPWNEANRNDLGLTLLAYGDVEGAVVELQKAVETAPGVAKYHNHLGIALLQKGDPDAAILHFREALRLTPGYPPAKINLERALSARKKKTLPPPS